MSTLEPKFRPEILVAGGTDADIRRALRTNEWRRLRPGAYSTSPEAAFSASEQRRLILDATVPKLGTDAVLSHTSAAVVHGLPIPDDVPRTVHVTRPRQGGGTRRPHVHGHGARLESRDVVELDGLAVTSVARTLLDCACLLSIDTALCMADAALHGTLVTIAELAYELSGAGQRSGVGKAREVFRFADGRSESPGESLSRLIFHRGGLSEPILQYEVREGRLFVGRCDFAWKQFRTIGEFDGRVKYGKHLLLGEDPGEAVWREKRREDALRRLGWIVVRWTWADLLYPERLVARILEAFELGRRLA